MDTISACFPFNMFEFDVYLQKGWKWRSTTNDVFPHLPTIPQVQKFSTQ